MTSNKLKQIAISQKNYFDLKRLGRAGDSFNDVITEVIKKIKMLQSGGMASDPNQIAALDLKPQGEVGIDV